MSNPYIGEIRMFGGNFAPNGWMLCQGQTLAIAENDALFQLIGTTYGGDGQSTFNLPNLQSRIPIHQGTNPNTGTTFNLGEASGVESVTLTVNQIASHSHPFLATADTATAVSPSGNLSATTNVSKRVYAGPASPTSPMAPQAINATGGSQPHANLQPYLCINFIISLFGIFPNQ